MDEASPEATPASIVDIPIAKGGASLSVNIDEIPDATFRLIVAEGLKAMLNKRMSKVGSVTQMAGDELAKANAKAMEIAEENLANLMSGKTTAPTKAAKVKSEVMVEARRLAKIQVRDAIKASGQKVSMVEASQITAAANTLIQHDPSILAEAEANIEARKLKAAEDSDKLAKVLAITPIHESPTLLAKAEAKAKERKSTLSAKQAGKVPPAKARSAERTERHH